MNKKNRLAGRFLPSRVYARWKWTVRFGLCAVPLILFLAGGLTLYLKPNRYQSAVVFEYLGNRPIQEAAALLKSHNVIELAASATELTKQLTMDMDTAQEVVVKSIETTEDRATGMIELKVTNAKKELARDLAVELVKGLGAYEASLVTHAVETRLEAAERSVVDAEDEAEAKQQTLAKLIAMRGDPAADPIAKLDIDAARREWDNAYSDVLAARAMVGEMKRALANPAKWVEVHSNATLSQKPFGNQADELLGEVALQALATGLALALAVPYLLELALPRRRAKALNGREQRYEDRDFMELSANG